MCGYGVGVALSRVLKKKGGKSATYKEGSISSTFFIGLLDKFE